MTTRVGRRSPVVGRLGIGRAVAAQLTGAGAQVVVAVRGRAAIDEAAAELSGAGRAGRTRDVTSEDAWSATVSDLGRLDGPAVAAGVLGPVGPLGATDPDEFARTVDVNLVGTSRTVQHCAPVATANSAIVTFSGAARWIRCRANTATRPRRVLCA